MTGGMKRIAAKRGAGGDGGSKSGKRGGGEETKGQPAPWEGRRSTSSAAGAKLQSMRMKKKGGFKTRGGGKASGVSPPRKPRKPGARNSPKPS